MSRSNGAYSGEEHNCQVVNFGADFGSSIIHDDLRLEQYLLKGQLQSHLYPISLDGQLSKYNDMLAHTGVRVCNNAN